MSLQSCLDFVSSKYDGVLKKLNEVFDTLEENKLYMYSGIFFLKTKGKVYSLEDYTDVFLDFSKDNISVIELILKTKLPEKAHFAHTSFPDGLEDGKKYLSPSGLRLTFKKKESGVSFVCENGKNAHPLALNEEFRLMKEDH